MPRHARNAVVAFAQQVLGAVSGAAGIFFVARQMPRAEFHLGIIGFALSFVGIFLWLQRSFDSAHVKRLSQGEPVAACMGTYLLLKLATTLAMIAAVLGSVFVWTELFGRGFQTQLHVLVIQLILVYQVLNAIGEYARRTLEGRQNIVGGQVLLSAEHIVKGAATIYVAFYGLDPFIAGARSALGLGAAYVIGAVALAIVATGLVAGHPVGKPSIRLIKSYTRYAAPATVTSSISLISPNITAIILQLFWGAGIVGIFFAPNRYVQFLPAVATAVSTALFPVFSRLHSEGRFAPETVSRVIRIVSMLVLPAIAVTIALPEAIVHVLLSDRFLASAPVLAILALGAYLNAMRIVLAAKLSGINRPEEATKAAAASLVANVTLSVILVAPSLFGIPLFGLKAVGAAIAVAASSLVGMGTVLRAAKEHAGVTLPPLWKHAIMFAVTAGVLRLVPLVVEQLSFRVWHLLAVGLLAQVIFYAVGWLIGEVDRDDVDLVQTLIHPSEWLSFLWRERRP